VQAKSLKVKVPTTQGLHLFEQLFTD